MYLMERLSQLPVLEGVFAGTLGDNALPDDIRKFLDDVRKKPKDLKRLLLTVTFHPSPQNTGLLLGPFKQTILELLLLNNQDTPGPFYDELRRISDDLQKKDASFRQQIDAERRLRNVMLKTAGKLGIDREKMKPFLIELLFEPLDFFLPPLALKFAQHMFPPRLVQRIKNSAVPEAHLVRLGRFLRRYGEVLQSKDAAFKQLVEQERNKRQQVQQEQQKKAKQAEEERRRKEQRRRRK